MPRPGSICCISLSCFFSALQKMLADAARGANKLINMRAHQPMELHRTRCRLRLLPRAT